MSKKSFATLHLETTASRGLMTGLMASHALAMVGCLANDLNAWIQLGLLSGVLFSLIRERRKYRRTSCLHLTLTADGHIETRQPDVTLTGSIRGSSVITPWLVLLHMDTASGPVYIPVARDATSPESFRLLRVMLACLEREKPGAEPLADAPSTD